MASKDEMRAARMARLGGSPAPTTATAEETQSSPSASFAAAPAPVAANTSTSVEDLGTYLTSAEGLRTLRTILYEGGGASLEDMNRWYGQGFQFCEGGESGGNGSSVLAYGLKQGFGGPCGVLAAVQAEMIGNILFGTSGSPSPLEGIELPTLTKEEIHAAFAKSICSILLRASAEEGRIVLVDAEDFTFTDFDNDSLMVQRGVKAVVFTSTEEAEAHVLRRLDLFSSTSGVIFYVMSLVLSRGIERVQGDMDIAMSGNTLIGRFGNGTQELINLLLTGRATTDVFDGNKPIGDSGLVVKGVSQRPRIGYLTHLEALQLCQVGSFYKWPSLPVWVVASQSHFTVLFCPNPKINEESESERLQNKAQRAFKSMDPDECGFIPADKLSETLMNVDEPVLYEILGEEEEVARLRGHLRTDGDIIIWSSFWEAVSRLLVGHPLDDIISTGNTDAAALAAVTTRERSDSDYARELQAQFNGTGATDTAPVAAAAEPSPMDVVAMGGDDLAIGSDGLPRSDSDIARMLSEQWANEDRSQATTPGAAPTPTPAVPAPAPAPASAPAPAAAIQEAPRESFTLYHFNGLFNNSRQPRLSPIKVTPRSTDSVIGRSVAMTGGSSSTSYLCPIEEVLRTRWDGCSLDFGEGPAPSID